MFVLKSKHFFLSKPLPFSLFMIMLVAFSCNVNKSKQQNERLDAWEKIRKAAKKRNIDYLLSISNDTLQCIECNKGESSVPKKLFFENYIDQIEISDHKPYRFDVEDYNEVNGYDKIYRINYAYDKDNKYNLIYTIITGHEGVKFLGVFSVP